MASDRHAALPWRLAAFAASIAALGGCTAAAPEHRATSTVFVSVDLDGGAITPEVERGIVETHAALATTPLVLQPVIDRLGLPGSVDSLAEAVSVRAPRNTVLIEISVTDPSPAAARRLADGVAAELVALSGTGVPSGVGAVELAVVEPDETGTREGD